ncbi:MAG TPA: A24 family peptidase [Candidatus Baltobacteraceae bacterium]|nr:A24 family peptidase [Candidatus Baltobacteraceae bacterium]
MSAGWLGPALMLVCAGVCAVTDLRRGLIYDWVTGSTALGIVVWSLASSNTTRSLLGACACGLPMIVVHYATRGRGLGLGDVKLSAVIGAGIGGVGAATAIGSAFVAGALWALPMLALGRVRRGDRVPFGPFLAVGAVFAVFMRSVHNNG